MDWRSIPTASATEAAWAAGFIDGEGCFSLYSYDRATEGRPGTYTWHFAISAGQKIKAPLDFLSSLFGGGVWLRKGTLWVWQITDAPRIEECLKHITPHLIVKTEQASVMQDYIDLLRSRDGRGRKVTSDELTQRHALAVRLADLKRVASV